MFQGGSVLEICNFVIFDMIPQEITPKTMTPVHSRAVVGLGIVWLPCVSCNALWLSINNIMPVWHVFHVGRHKLEKLWQHPMHTHVRTLTHTNIYICVHCMHACMWPCACMCVCVCVCVRACVCTYTHKPTPQFKRLWPVSYMEATSLTASKRYNDVDFWFVWL